MTITFNNIPSTLRVPGVYTEVDNSRALANNLVSNPHVALIIGQRTSAGTVAKEVLTPITRNNLADGYFGVGSQLARMCNFFKNANPYTELYAIALDDHASGVAATGEIDCSSVVASETSVNSTLHLLVAGTKVDVALTSGMTPTEVGAAVAAAINADTTLPVTASAAAGVVTVTAKNDGENGNFIDIRFNYYTGQSFPSDFTTDPTITDMASGTTNPDVSGIWTLIENEQFHYIIHPYVDSANLTEIETELATRFSPMINKQGHAITVYGGTAAQCTTLGNARNSAHSSIMGIYNSPTTPDDMAASLGGIASYNLNIDPARPLHYLSLPGVLPPSTGDRFTLAEKEVLLFDGIATSTVDSGGNVLIERLITTYQKNALDVPDASYLDIQTLATLSEIRYQYNTRMASRFIVPRFKLADDGFPVQGGQYIATPSTIRDEIISLFHLLYDQGLIENLDDFKDNLIVERDTTDLNRVNVLIAPDLVNQFRVLATQIQFIL